MTPNHEEQLAEAIRVILNGEYHEKAASAILLAGALECLSAGESRADYERRAAHAWEQALKMRGK